MICDETDPEQDDVDLLVQVSDEALEAACGGLMRGLPTLAYGLLLHLSPTSALSDALITRLRTDGAGYESQSDFREKRISASNQVRCR
jgi:hypothetical protein